MDAVVVKIELVLVKINDTACQDSSNQEIVGKWPAPGARLLT